MAKKKSEPDTSGVDRVAPKGIDLEGKADQDVIEEAARDAGALFASTDPA